MKKLNQRANQHARLEFSYEYIEFTLSFYWLACNGERKTDELRRGRRKQQNLIFFIFSIIIILLI